MSSNDRGGIKLGIYKPDSQDITDGMLITNVNDGPKTYKFGDESLTVPKGGPEIDDLNEFYAANALSQGGLVPKDIKFENTDKGVEAVYGDTRVIVDHSGASVTIQDLTGPDKWSSSKVEIRDANNKITEIQMIDCETSGGCTGTEPDSKVDEYSIESRDKKGTITNWIQTNIKDETGTIETTKTEFERVQDPFKDGINYYGITSIEIKGQPKKTFENPIIHTTGLLGTQYYVVKGDTTVKLDYKDGKFVSEDGKISMPVPEDLKDKMNSDFITAEHGKSRFNYFGDILNQWSSATSGYKGMSLFYDEPDPIIELDDTMYGLLGGIEGWKSLICESEMTQSMDNGMAFSSFIDGAYAHIEGDKMSAVHFNESGGLSDNYYRVSFSVDPGSEAEGCDMDVSVVLYVSGGSEFIEYSYIGTKVNAEQNESGDWTLSESLGSVAVKVESSSSIGKVYLSMTDNAFQLTTSPYVFEVREGEASISYSGSNMIFLNDKADFSKVCIEFDKIFPNNLHPYDSCLVGVEEGDEICNSFSNQGSSEKIDDPCSGSLSKMIPSCWGR